MSIFFSIHDNKCTMAPTKSLRELETRSFVLFLHEMVSKQTHYSAYLPQMSYVMSTSLVVLCEQWHRGQAHPLSPSPSITVIGCTLRDIFESQYSTKRFIRAFPNEEPHINVKSHTRNAWLWDWDKVSKYTRVALEPAERDVQ
jgi:hypothetical protein